MRALKTIISAGGNLRRKV